MIHFDRKLLVDYLSAKGWGCTYSQDFMHYWNCVWEDGSFMYCIQVPVFPHTKLTNLKGKVQGYVVTKSTGEVWDAPHFTFQLDADKVRTYNDIRMWISYLMDK